MKNKLTLTTILAVAVLFTGVAIAQAHTTDEDHAHDDAEAEVRADVRLDTSVSDQDSDSDAAEDEPERQAAQEGDSVDGNDPDSDDRAAGYNNSRSNRSTVTGDADVDADGRADVRASDLDDDGDGVADAEAESRVGVTKEIDKSTPMLMQTLSIDASSPLLFDGVSVRASQVCDESGDCDDEDSSVPPMLRDISVSVQGNEVRGWDPEQKEAVRQRLQVAGEMNTANDFGIEVASAALENEDVVDISSDAEATEMKYNTTVRLFGFIPKNVTAVARAESNGEVSVDYPWYGFLARKGDQSLFSSLVADLRAKHDVMISVEEEGVKRTVRDESEEN